MPHEFATRLWALTRLRTPVIIARPELTPREFADSHLFVHKEKPTTPSSMGSTSAAIEPIKTAQTADGGKTTDALSGGKDDTHGGSAALAGPVNAQRVASAAVAGEAPETDRSFGTERVVAASVATAVPLPVSPPKPAEIAPAATGAAIAVFVSRKNKRIYVRQHFSPLFDAPIAIDHPEQPLGTHVFTAVEYLDGSSLRWNVVSLPGEQTSRNMESGKKNIRGAPRRDRALEPLPDLPPQTPRQALARIEIPQNVIDQISQLIVPGSSLIVSDQGLGEETGEGTSFIVVTH